MSPLLAGLVVFAFRSLCSGWPWRHFGRSGLRVEKSRSWRLHRALCRMREAKYGFLNLTRMSNEKRFLMAQSTRAAQIEATIRPVHRASCRHRCREADDLPPAAWTRLGAINAIEIVMWT
jgi:hypothetical protein